MYTPYHRSRPWNGVLAWVGIDGALLDVPRLSNSESIEGCLMDLGHVVTELQHDRLAADLSVAEASSLAVATDTYGKHRNKYRALYEFF